MTRKGPDYRLVMFLVGPVHLIITTDFSIVAVAWMITFAAFGVFAPGVGPLSPLSLQPNDRLAVARARWRPGRGRRHPSWP